MSGLRLTTGAVLGAAGIVLAMVSPAVAASAAPGISILSAGPDSTGDPYNLTVAADDGNGVQITTMTAHVFSASMADLADPTMTYVSGPPGDQVWVASPPISASMLPAGTYTVTVDASDGIETDNGLAAPGSFSFAYATSSLTVAAAPPSVTLGSQDVTFSGTLKGTAPGGTPVGIANAPVNLAGGSSNPVATTDSNGNFSYAATGVEPGSYTFSVPGPASNAYPAPDPASVTVSAQPATTTFTMAAPSPASVTQGMQTVTFAGTVTVTPTAPASAVGVGSGVPVFVSIGGNAPILAAHTTDAAGDFTYTAQNVAPTTPYIFSVNSTPLYPAGSSAPVEVTATPAPTMISVTPSPAVVTFGRANVTLAGTVTALPPGGTAVAVAGAPVYLNGSTTSFATTDSAGHFTYNATGITQNTTETFSVNSPASGLYSEATGAVPVNVDPGTTAMAVTASPPDINLATSVVTFTGAVSVTPFGATTPEGAGNGIPVFLTIGSGSPHQVTTTDDANGDFTFTANNVTQAADYVFSVNSGTLYTAATASVPIGQNQVQSTLTVIPSPGSVTEGSQTVTFAGTLTGMSPGGTTPVPIQNAPVVVSINGAAPVSVGRTDVNGDFTYKVSEVSRKTAYAFSVAKSLTYTQATENVTVALDQARTRITHIRVTPAHLKYGQNATLRATAQYLNGKTWVALPRAVVHLAEGKTRLRTVTTASNGTFAATLPSTHGPGWTATVASGSLILQTSAMGNLSIALPLTVRSFSARLAVNGKISASGCLEVIATAGLGPDTSVDIQYASTARGRWKSLGTLPLHNQTAKSRSCRSADESYFSGSIRAKLDNAYYRADFAATYAFQSAVSKIVHAWKYPTRIISISATPHRISKSGVVTIKGRLETKIKSWRPWAGKRVDIIANDKGTSFFYPLGSTTTNSRGYFSLRAKGTAGNYVAINYAVYPGDGTHLACQSRGADVTISNDNSNVVLAAANAKPEPFSLGELGRMSAAGIPMLPALMAWPPFAALVASKPIR
jgi:hypothetical protein